MSDGNSQYGDALFAEILFADVAFGPGAGWNEICPSVDDWIDANVAQNLWTNQPIADGGWDNQIPDFKPLTKCRRK